MGWPIQFTVELLLPSACFYEYRKNIPESFYMHLYYNSSCLIWPTSLIGHPNQSLYIQLMPSVNVTHLTFQLAHKNLSQSRADIIDIVLGINLKTIYVPIIDHLCVFFKGSYPTFYTIINICQKYITIKHCRIALPATTPSIKSWNIMLSFQHICFPTFSLGRY